MPAFGQPACSPAAGSIYRIKRGVIRQLNPSVKGPIHFDRGGCNNQGYKIYIHGGVCLVRNGTGVFANEAITRHNRSGGFFNNQCFVYGYEDICTNGSNTLVNLQCGTRHSDFVE